MACTRSAARAAFLAQRAAPQMLAASSVAAARCFNSASLNRAMELNVPEMPLGSLADRVAAPFGDFLEELSRQKRAEAADGKRERPLYVPRVPRVLCVSRMAAESPLLRDVLVVDSTKPLPKPRLSWYNPYDTTWIPSGWFADGLVADMHYYFGAPQPGAPAPHAAAAAPQPQPQPNGA